MIVVLGTLWFSIKHIEAPYVFDWEHVIALYAIQGIRASFPAVGDVSLDSSSCCTEINIHRDMRLVSQGISVVS